MKAIVADDEPHLAQDIERRLARIWPELEICAVLHDGMSAATALREHAPEIAFLDIRMPGMNGLDVARAAPAGCKVVFITAFDDHAVKAFEQAAADYLLKPVSDERLESCVERLKQRNAAKHDELLKKLTLLLEEKPAYLRWIRAQTGQTVYMVAVDEVSYFKSTDKYILAVTRDAEFLLRTPLRELLAQLDPAEFWQVHRSIVVNVRQIAAAHHKLMGRVILDLKQRPEKLDVSRSHAHLFKQM